MKLIVAQFCRPKDCEITNECTQCARSENVVQFSHYHQLIDEPATGELITQSVYHWLVGS